MDDCISLALLQSVVNTQKNLVVIFKNDKPILTNKSYNDFFGVKSCEDYVKSFGAFENNFVPHPLYFHKEKMPESQKWFDGILKLPEIDRVVSMMTPSFEPHAFSVILERTIPEYTIATFSDITQNLIKRIMIENNTSIDSKSGAYSKKYFTHISRSYQDAALFNEKMIGAILITLEDDLENSALLSFVEEFKKSTRQDDMLIRWSAKEFLLIYLVDSEKNAELMMEKFKNKNYNLQLFTQQKEESIKTLIKRIGN
jgi:GGDEF domain-containing protein